MRLIHSLNRAVLATAVCTLMGARAVLAIDLTGGVMTAVPTKDGKAPVIDGKLDDWDLSAAEPVYISRQTVKQYNIDWALMYDVDALYISATASLPGRPLRNPAEPQDGFWWHDLLQVRLAADPSLQFPIDPNRDAKNDRVAHLSFWRNHESGAEYVNIARGAKLDLGQVNNPPGAMVKIIPHGTDGYVMEARIPWSAMNVPDGKNPFKPGDRMTAIFEALWTGGDSSRVAAVYSQNPATFAFMRPSSWGRVEFAAKGFAERRRPTIASIIDQISNAPDPSTLIGVPIEVDVPDDGLKLSVNIVSETGAVIRDIAGAVPQKRGKAVVRWDGKDQFGHPMKPGSYRWSAYMSHGLKARYRGAVGTAGDPPYQTFDGKGGWGGDHSLPIDVATDETGYYFLWPVAEAGAALVKTDYAGKVQWRGTPFVGGGFGPFYSIAVDEKYVYLAIGGEDVRLVRLDKKTGKLLLWSDDGTKELPLYKTTLKAVDERNSPHNARHYKLPPLPNHQVGHPDPCGMAIKAGTLYLSSYSRDQVLVFDVGSSKTTGTISVPSPRGLTLGQDGNIYAVSYPTEGPSQIVRIDAASQKAESVVTVGLAAPYDVAVTKDGTLFVSDLAEAQQIKVFAASGKLVRTVGKAGGRPYQGKYTGDAFLKPAGLALDSNGQLLITEAAIPKVYSRLDTATGQINKRWFGPGVYWNHCWPMPDDPEQVFYTLNHGFGLAKPSEKEDERAPIYYWAPQHAGFDFVGDIENLIPSPETIRAGNGELYFVRDSNPHLIMLLRDGIMRPVAMFTYRAPHLREENKTGKPYLDVWIDANGDGQLQDGEKSVLDRLADGSPLPVLASTVGSFHMEPNGDLYFVTVENKILKLPAGGFATDGMMKWSTRSMVVAVPTVLPGQTRLDTGFRQGIVGVRLDAAGNLYTLFNARVPGGGKPYEFANDEIAKQMYEGMGHTSGMNAVKFAKFDSGGNLQWLAGRKATAGARPGEMYHFWNMAGLINDQYVAGGSEWGQIYIYTQDGFFVDALMNNPGESPPPGPYTFGGETSGGRVAYFPKRDELWAYALGMAYIVEGFKDGKVAGERRVSGTVVLDRVYEMDVQTSVRNEPLTISSVGANPIKDPNVWAGVPVTKMLSRTLKAELAGIQLAIDDDNLYARIHVNDDSPQANSADSLQTAFKGGDTAGIVLGPVSDRKDAGAGDVRIMAATIGGKPVLIGMKPVSTDAQEPFEYTTPAAGTVKFEYVDVVPGGQLRIEVVEGGYVVVFSVPRSFINLDLSGKIRGDVEVRLSGAGARGLQAVSREYLFTPPTSATTMTDDVPTEARLYPEYWGPVELKGRG